MSELGEAIVRIFTQVLMVCDQQGLIGREMFAIDGVKLPRNASKAEERHAQGLPARGAKLEAAVRSMLQRHRDEDAPGPEPSLRDAKRDDRAPDARSRASPRLAQGPPQGSPRRARRDPQEQPDRQRLGQDGHRQGRDPGLHRGGRGR